MYQHSDELWFSHPGADPARNAWLTAEQERDLGWKIINDQCDASRKQLEEANRHLVDAIVGKYAGHALPLAVITEAGNRGLALAVDDFDPARGLRFSTRAGWWIRQAIRQAALNAPEPLSISRATPQAMTPDRSKKAV